MNADNYQTLKGTKNFEYQPHSESGFATSQTETTEELQSSPNSDEDREGRMDDKETENKKRNKENSEKADVEYSPVKEEWPDPPPGLHMLDTPVQPQATTKRRRTVLSIAEKADLIRRLHNGESQRQLAFEYGIGTSTVSDVKKHEAEILKYVETNGDYVAMTRRKLECGAKVDVEEAVFLWLLQEVRSGRELTGSEVMARARSEHRRLRGSEEFRASTGWLERFKHRYNIRSFRPGEEANWRPIVHRSSTDDTSKYNRGRRRGRPPLTSRLENIQSSSRERASKGRALDFLEHVFDGSSPSLVKSEVESHDPYEYTNDARPDLDLSPETQTSLQPVVSIEEGHMSLDLAPVEEIPSSAEAASLLSKALVWAAAQPDTTPQELFVVKQLQTKAAIRGAIKASHSMLHEEH